MATHLAAVAPAKGTPFEIQTRSTPKPGPNELLIAVKSIALNPADWIMRDTGLLIPSHPTVIGFDIAGTVVDIGEGVPTDLFQLNETRVAAYAAGYWRSWTPDYGAFQERVLVPWQHAAALPDQSLSWNAAATLPVSIEVPLNAWDVMGIPRVGQASAAASPKKDEALLVWGGSSSVGSMGVQTARLLREDPNSSFAAVYATAGAANLDYVASLGANRVFDYTDPQAVNAIVSAAEKDGLVIRHCFLAMGQLALCQTVLKAFTSSDSNGQSLKMGKIASAPPVPADAQTFSGQETIFVLPSTVEEERLEQFRYWLGTVLKDGLAKGVLTPSPKLTIVGKGLEATNAGLTTLSRGVSCTKLVVEIAP